MVLLKRNNKYRFWEQSTAGTDKNPNSTLRINSIIMYEGWNFNSGNYLFTTDTK